MFVSWVCIAGFCVGLCVSAESHRFIRIAATLFGRAELHTLGPEKKNEHVCAHALPKPSGLLIGLCTPEHGMLKTFASWRGRKYPLL